MNGLKSDIDLSFFKGRELAQVAIGLYQTVFGFDEDVAISVEGEFCYFDGQNEWKWQPTPGSSLVAARTAALLGMTVESVSGNANGMLSLEFSNGHRLVIIDSSKEFESYNITRPGQNIVV